MFGMNSRAVLANADTLIELAIALSKPDALQMMRDEAAGHVAKIEQQQAELAAAQKNMDDQKATVAAAQAAVVAREETVRADELTLATTAADLQRRIENVSTRERDLTEQAAKLKSEMAKREADVTFREQRTNELIDGTVQERLTAIAIREAEVTRQLETFAETAASLSQREDDVTRREAQSRRILDQANVLSKLVTPNEAA